MIDTSNSSRTGTVALNPDQKFMAPENPGHVTIDPVTHDALVADGSGGRDLTIVGRC